MDIDQLALDTVEAIAKIDPDKLKGGRVRAVAQAQNLIRHALETYAAEQQAEALDACADGLSVSGWHKAAMGIRIAAADLRRETEERLP